MGEHKVVYYPIESRGASFKAEEHDLLLCNGECRPVGVAVGQGGCLFVTVCHMPANDASPTYRSDILQDLRMDKEPTPQQYDITAAPLKKSAPEISSADWSRRHAAYEETLRRGGNAPNPTPLMNDESLGDLSSNDPRKQLAAVVGFFDTRRSTAAGDL